MVTVSMLAGLHNRPTYASPRGESVLPDPLAKLMIPVQVIMVSLFDLVTALGLYDDCWAVILPTLAPTFGVPGRAVHPGHSARTSLWPRIHWAGHLRVFVRIVLTGSRPLLAVLFFMSVLQTSNDLVCAADGP